MKGPAESGKICFGETTNVAMATRLVAAHARFIGGNNAPTTELLGGRLFQNDQKSASWGLEMSIWKLSFSEWA